MIRQLFWAFVDIWEALKNGLENHILRALTAIVAGISTYVIVGAILDHTNHC